MIRFLKNLFNSQMIVNYAPDEQENSFPELREQAAELFTFPVSPFFTQKVLARAKSMNSGVWDYLNIFPESKMRLAMVAIIILIVTVINIPVQDQDLAQTPATNDFQYLVSGEMATTSLDTNEKVLQFALSN